MDKLNRRIQNGFILYTTTNKNEYHRINGPAAIRLDGRAMFWYKNGLSHRKNKPTIIHSDGYVDWYEEGRVIENNM